MASYCLLSTGCYSVLFILFSLFVSGLPIIEYRVKENFQDINFEDLEQQLVGFEGKCP
jgi:hypothetical protein